MAITIDRTGGTTISTGIRLRVVIPAGYTPVLERSLTSGSGFTEIATLAISDGTSQDYLDPLALDGVTRYYRARSRGAVTSDSAASAEVSGKPKTQS